MTGFDGEFAHLQTVRAHLWVKWKNLKAKSLKEEAVSIVKAYLDKNGSHDYAQAGRGFAYLAA